MRRDDVFVEINTTPTFFTEPKDQQRIHEAGPFCVYKKEKSDSDVASVSPSQTILSSQIHVCKSNSSNRNVLVHHQGLELWTPCSPKTVLFNAIWYYQVLS